MGERASQARYLKGLLVSDAAKGLLPDWAFFVRGVVDRNALRHCVRTSDQSCPPHYEAD